MLQITDTICLDDSELHLDFVRSGGPGGQNVNKVSTAVQLRFDVGASPSLGGEVKARLRTLAGSRMTADGVLILQANRFRSQSQNRQDALDRLAELVRKAAVRPIRRRKTRPTLGSRQRRLESKRQRSQTKSMRRKVDD